MTPTLAPLPASLPDAVPFVGPETLERQRGAPFRARLGANENGFGPSPLAVEAMRQAAAEVWKYGDPTNHDLKAALAAHCGCEPENIVVGEGIDGLLGEKHAIAKPLLLHIAGEDHLVPKDAQAAVHAGLDDHPRVTIHDYPG